MARKILICALALSTLLAGASARAEKARARGKPQPAAAQQRRDCPRASYPGDPVCFGADDGHDLPTPSSGAIHRPVAPGVRVNDDVSVTGADPKAMSKQPVYLNNPNPNPRRQDVGGGAAVNYKF